uniref:Uncharacterized protein n=1 Tax=Ciona savignyi TaxID=51511 RepID=H2YX92_CIOSA
MVVYRYWWKLPHPRFPPGVRGIPILGATPFFGRYPQETIAKWSREKYGPVMSVRFGQQDAVVLNDYESIHEALVKNINVFHTRPSCYIVECFTDGYGFGFADGHKKYLEVRNFSLAALRGLGIGRHTMEMRVSGVAQDLVQRLEDCRGQPTDVKMLIGSTVCNVISSVVFGKSYDYDDKAFQYAVQCSFDCFGDPEHSEYLNVLFFYPKLRFFPPFNKALEKFIKVHQGLIDFNRKEIEEHEKNLDENEPADFIDAFLIEMKKHSPDTSWFHKTQLLHCLGDMFIAGTETSTNTILWAMLALIHFPKVQQDLYKEIHKVLGEHVIPSADHGEKLPLLRAFIQELYRYRTIVPMSLQHRASEDVEIGGHLITKDTTVSPNIDAVHQDEKLFKNPKEFNIYRHIEGGKFFFNKKIIPFGIGARSCLGEKLARLEVFLFLANIIRRFEILPDPKNKCLPPFKDGISGLLYVPFRFKMVAKPRLVN